MTILTYNGSSSPDKGKRCVVLLFEAVSLPNIPCRTNHGAVGFVTTSGRPHVSFALLP